MRCLVISLLALVSFTGCGSKKSDPPPLVSDLFPSSPSFSPTTPSGGNPFTISYSVGNQGIATSNPTTVTVYEVVGGVPGPVLDTFACPGILSGGAVGHTTVSLVAGSGSHTFVVKVTPDGLETNTGNDTSSLTSVTVSVATERG